MTKLRSDHQYSVYIYMYHKYTNMAKQLLMRVSIV